jgi:hypothetical protein
MKQKLTVRQGVLYTVSAGSFTPAQVSNSRYVY